jgi:hypothetical protein
MSRKWKQPEEFAPWKCCDWKCPPGNVLLNNYC